MVLIRVFSASRGFKQGFKSAQLSPGQARLLAKNNRKFLISHETNQNIKFHCFETTFLYQSIEHMYQTPHRCRIAQL